MIAAAKRRRWIERDCANTAADKYTGMARPFGHAKSGGKPTFLTAS
jgi:hypothetical protein